MEAFLGTTGSPNSNLPEGKRGGTFLLVTEPGLGASTVSPRSFVDTTAAGVESCAQSLAQRGSGLVGHRHGGRGLEKLSWKAGDTGVGLDACPRAGLGGRADQTSWGLRESPRVCMVKI